MKGVTSGFLGIELLFDHKGTYLYHGVLDGTPYAISGREVYDGFRGTAGAAGTMRASYSVSPDGSRFSYTITRGPSDRPTVLSGWEIRVDP